MDNRAVQTNFERTIQPRKQHTPDEGASASTAMKPSFGDPWDTSDWYQTLPDVQSGYRQGKKGRAKKHPKSTPATSLRSLEPQSLPGLSDAAQSQPVSETAKDAEAPKSKEQRSQPRHRKKNASKNAANTKSSDVATFHRANSGVQTFTPQSYLQPDLNGAPASFNNYNTQPPLYDSTVPKLQFPGEHLSPTRSQPAAFAGSPAYLSLTDPAPRQLGTPQPLLIVLDLNGTLLYRHKGGNNSITLRPGLYEFLSYVFSHHCVMIWTSAQPHSRDVMLDAVLTEPAWRGTIAASWARDTLGLPPHLYNRKAQVTKDLDQVWWSRIIQMRHPWRQHGWSWGVGNTILVDDSIAKAWKQPYNLCEVPEFTKDSGEAVAGAGSDQAPLAKLTEYIEHIRHFDNVAAYMRRRPFQV